MHVFDNKIGITLQRDKPMGRYASLVRPGGDAEAQGLQLWQETVLTRGLEGMNKLSRIPELGRGITSAAKLAQQVQHKVQAEGPPARPAQGCRLPARVPGF